MAYRVQLVIFLEANNYKNCGSVSVYSSEVYQDDSEVGVVVIYLDPDINELFD